MTVDEALNIAVIHTLSIKHWKAVSEAAEAASILAAEVRLLRDEVNGLTGSLDRAEKALKEAQEQEPVAFWWIGPDGKDNGGPYRGKPSDAAIDNARNMGCEPVLLYARPVAAAPTVAVPAVPEEWREVLRECADDLAIELDMRYGDSRKYPSEQRKYEAEMQPVYRARSLLQSADHSERNLEKVAPDCRACAILPCSCK